MRPTSPRERVRALRSESAALIVLALAQTAAMIGAWSVTQVGVRDRIRASAEYAALDQNARVADRFSDRLRELGVGPVEPGSLSWARVQDLVENLYRTTGTMACVLGADGQMLNHPLMRPNEHLRTPEGEAAIERIERGVNASGPMSAALPSSATAATRYIPELRARLVVDRVDESAIVESERAAAAVEGWTLAATLAAVLVTAVATVIVMMRHQRLLREERRLLEGHARFLGEQRDAARHAIILGLAKLADYRDSDTGGHLERICSYSEILARSYSGGSDEVDDAWVRTLNLAASLHDIGKVGIPDRILLKPGPLTSDERMLMERHTLIGAETLTTIREQLGDDQLVEMSIDVALHHHERWDGGGYPCGLSGREIPLAARIVAIADTYDALTSRRVYKAAIPHEEAVRIILEGTGTQFDPALVATFRELAGRFEVVRRVMHARERLAPAAA